MTYRNIYQLFRERTAEYRGKPVFYTKTERGWHSKNWEEFEDQVHDFACALLANGLTKAQSVAILAGNVPEWTIADIAAIAAGGIGVGIYPTSSVEQTAYIIDHSDAQFVLVDTVAQLNKVLAIGNLEKIKAIVVLDPSAVSEGKVIHYDDFLLSGRRNKAKFLPVVEKAGYEADFNDTAILVYTSGTTGSPKGAMLSHRYILNSVESLRRSVPIFDDDTVFSYLPSCHVAERISGIYNRLYSGTAVHFVDDLSKLYAYMLEVKPTIFASLPRFFEKIYAKVVAEHGRHPAPQIVKDAFGGNIRLLTSGGAPLPGEIADFFARAGVPILQAYGLTENICVAFNRARDFKFGTVGKAMPMCEIKIAGDGEILVNSPMMFSGYYKEPQKTREMFDQAGWLVTGDLGELDKDGFLKITGRKKEIIVLSSGKNVAPALVENMVKENHLVSQCFLHGDGKNYCVALISLNEAEMKMYAAAHDIEFRDYAELLNDVTIRRTIDETIAKANERVSNSEQIKKYLILERDFSADRDEITPTLKLKRNKVAFNYASDLEKLYCQT